MPVHIEWLETPTNQDWTDLEKLYAEAPAHWFESLEPAAAGQSHGRTYVEQHLSHARWKLAAGRFNDRLIAAASIRPDDSGYWIDDLVVRQVTRNRGVAHQLLIRLCQWADVENHKLQVNTQQGPGDKLQQYGFEKTEQGWQREPGAEIVAEVQQ